MRLDRIAQGLFLLLVFLLAVGLFWPMAQLALTLFEAPTLADFFTAYNTQSFINTMLMGVSVGLLSSIAGFVIAYSLVSLRGPQAYLMKALFPCALFAPSVMPAIGLIYLFGHNGIIFQTSLYGAVGIFLGAFVFTLPHSTMQCLLALERFDAKLFDAARSLSVGAVKQFFTLLLPHSRGALINAFLIAFVLTITDFGVPKLLGGPFPMLATEIYNQAIGTQNTPAAVFLSLWLLAPAATAFYFTARFFKKKSALTPTKTLVGYKTPWLTLSMILSWSFVLFEVMTIAIVIYGSFVTFWPYVPELTLANYEFKNSTYGLSPWGNSFILATGVAIFGTVMAFAGALIEKRLLCIAPLFSKCYEVLTRFPLCIPGTVLGLAFALSFAGLSVFEGTVGAMILLIFNTVIHLFTVSHLTAVNTLEGIDSRYETVGLSLGVSRWKTLYRVVLPLSRTGLREVFCYLFASALTTISAVVFLYTPQTMPAAVAAIQMIDSGFLSEGAAMSTLIFCSALPVRFIMIRLSP